jgi:hypothetical protein
MKKNFVSACLAFALIMAAGCASNTIQDARGPSEICEVHHAFMHEENVPGPKGQIPMTREYYEATKRLFPHAYLDFSPDYHHRLMIYVCDECVQAKELWKQQHPNLH